MGSLLTYGATPLVDGGDAYAYKKYKSSIHYYMEDIQSCFI